jgi:hypothetical protein
MVMNRIPNSLDVIFHGFENDSVFLPTQETCCLTGRR